MGPKIIAELNDYKVQLVKVQGEWVWHKHDDTDELFLLIAGRLTMQMREGDVDLGPGDLLVVPRGVEHCPKAAEVCQLLLIESFGTPNTGDVGGSGPRRRSVSARDQSSSVWVLWARKGGKNDGRTGIAGPGR